MFLKKIELKGFKSFANREEIIIEDGITAIVGPNGSGKSNISDAIKWVLGEQSAKSLRGSKMEDVIFSGTERRKALGYAEVNLVFNNEYGKLPIEYNEVSIKRRLFKTGESEYYINKNNCRLKDIKELFMDTGIGKDGYSVIGQGRVEDILSTKSEIRRNVFEEAAGIVKYKTRKEEAERKLVKTEDNLERVKDIIYELNLRINPLKIQSEKAKEYLEYKNNLKKLELNYLVREYEKYRNQIDPLQNQKNSILEIKEIILSKRNDLEKKLTQKKDEIKKDEVYLLDSEKNKSEKAKQYESLINNIEMLKQKSEILDDNIKNNFEEIDKLEIRNTEFNEKIDQIKIENEKIINELEITKKEISNYGFEFKNNKKLIDESYKKIDFEKDRMYKIYNNINKLSSDINTLESISQNISDRFIQLNEEVEINKEDVKIKQGNLEEFTEKLRRKNIEINDLNLVINNLMKNHNDLEKNHKTEESNLRKVTYELNNINSRLDVLENMETYYEGYYKSVQQLMRNHKNNSFLNKSIYGSVADIIETKSKYEIAIETALGSSIQNVIVKNDDAAERIIGYLKEKKIGRVTFLPLASIKGKGLRNEEKFILKENGVIGTADTLVNYDGEYNNVIKYLLGRVLIVENINFGFKAARKLGHSVRIVSLDGGVINPGGAVTGGYISKKSNSLLSRRRKIEEFKIESKNFNILKEKTKSTIDSLDKEINLIKINIKDNRDKQNATGQEKLELISRINWNNEEILNVNNRIKKYEDDLKYLSDQSNEKKENIEKLKTKIDSENLTISEIERIIKEISDNSENNRIKYEKMNNKITNIKVDFASKEQKTKMLDEKLKDFEEELLRLSENKQIKLSNISSIRNEIKLINEKINNSLEESSKHKSDFALLEEKYYKVKNEKDKIQENIYNTQEEINDINKRITNILDEENVLSVKIERYKTKLEEASNVLWNNYEMNYAMALEYKDESISFTKLTREVNILKKNIKILGDVNVNAIEEYKEIKERYDFLENQRQDLFEAKMQLNKVIKELERKMKEKFLREFEFIKIKFCEVFQKLFNGGRANIFLEDEEDALNSNIEIIAQPPGKNLNKISLLSGGEKALTAIALLFAILKTKPTPFCILDEIEAALDDANVYRFAQFLRRYSEETQFLVITHRRGTMENVDTLYGTIMEEKGVTKLVSLKLSEINFLEDYNEG